MALVACRECGKNISTEARKCIGCGVPNPTSKKKRINKDTSAFTFIEKVKYFLNGQYSLAYSFWFVGFVLQLAFAIPLAYFSVVGVDDVSDFTAFILIVYAFFLYAYGIGVIIGQWRSAGFYIEENSPPFWGYVVRVLNVLAALGLVFQLITLVST